MVESISLIKLVIDSSSGIFGFIKKEAALSKAEKYLMQKYSLTTPREIEQVGSYPKSVAYYHKGGWEKALQKLTSKVISAKKLNMQLCEDCGDLFLFLQCKKHVLESTKEYISKSPTMDSLSDLARGKGTELSLKIAQRELKDWKKIEGPMIKPKR